MLVDFAPKIRRSGIARLTTQKKRHLLMLMTILTQALFALVRGHLVPLMFLSVRHND